MSDIDPPETPDAEPETPDAEPEAPDAEPEASETPRIESETPEPETDAPPSTEDLTGLRRVRDGRIFLGVAGGLARRYKIEPVVVRVAFILLSLVWGLGVLLYLSLWILVPMEGAASNPRRSRHLVIVLAAVIAVVALLARPGSHGTPRLVVVVAVITLAIALFDELRHPRGVLRTFVRAIMTMVGFGVGIAVLALAAALIAGPVAGIPLGGGVGARVVHPASVAPRSTYRMLAGTLQIDLRGTSIPSGARLDASVDVGRLEVIVPDGERVVIDARTGVGGVDQAPFINYGLNNRAPTIYLHLGVGVGRVLVTRLLVPR